MKLGIFGGTFNPIHIAHLRIAEEARIRFGLDRVIFVPAGTPPHKPLAGDLSFADRFAMVRLAIADNPCFAISDLEGTREGLSYSVDTLRTLHHEFPGDDLYFIIGGDSFLDIGTWHDFSAIFNLCNIVVLQRPGAVISSLQQSLPVAIAREFCYDDASQSLVHCSGHAVYMHSGILLDISSSEIRELARLHRSIRYLVPDAVEHYIKEHRIYLNVEHE